MVRGVRGVVHEAGAACVDGAGDEGEADGALLGDSLEGADEVGAFEVLFWESVSTPKVKKDAGGECRLPLSRESTDLSTHQGHLCHRKVKECLP